METAKRRIKGSIERLEELDKELLELYYERDSAILKLRESEHRYRALCEAGHEAIAIHRDRKVLAVNKSFEKLVGYTESELRNDLLLMFKILAPGCRDEVQQRIESEIETPYRCQYIHKNGTILDVYVRPKYVRYNGAGLCRAAVVTLWEERGNGQPS